MHIEHHGRFMLVWILGGAFVLFAGVSAIYSGVVHGQSAVASPAGQAPADRADRPQDDAADTARNDSEITDDPSPGNFLGSTYIPTIPAADGQPAEAFAAAPPPPPPVPADAAGDAVRQQINNETANLLALAYALKSEVDKTNKDQLSITVVRKAGQIEQLARKVRDEMRPALSKN